LSLSMSERVNLIELDEEYPSHHFLTEYQHRSGRERFTPVNGKVPTVGKKGFGVEGLKGQSATHPWGKQNSLAALNKRGERGVYSSQRTGFGLRSIDLDNYEENIVELQEEGVSIFDVGRLPSLHGLMNERRRKRLVIHDLLSMATNIVYCVKAEPLQLLHLQNFLNELNSQKYDWEITFLFTMYQKSRKGKELLDQFGNLAGRFNHLVVDFDARFSENFPAKRALTGNVGKQISQLIQVIR